MPNLPEQLDLGTGSDDSDSEPEVEGGSSDNEEPSSEDAGTSEEDSGNSEGEEDSEDQQLDQALLDLMAARDAREAEAVGNAIVEETEQAAERCVLSLLPLTICCWLMELKWLINLNYLSADPKTQAAQLLNLEQPETLTLPATPPRTKESRGTQVM